MWIIVQNKSYINASLSKTLKHAHIKPKRKKILLWMRASIRNMLAIHVFMQIKWKIKLYSENEKNKIQMNITQLCITSQLMLCIMCTSSSMRFTYMNIYLRMVLALALVLALVCMNDWCTIVIEGYLKCNFIFYAHRVHANSNSEIFHILWALNHCIHYHHWMHCNLHRSLSPYVN